MTKVEIWFNIVKSDILKLRLSVEVNFSLTSSKAFKTGGE